MRLLRSFVLGLSAVLLSAGSAWAVTIDFETDDFNTALVNGQAINTAPNGGDLSEEFGNLVSISGTVIGIGSNLGPAIFDSTPCPTGPNCAGADPDLFVDMGNILILQNNAFPNSTNSLPNGLVFDTPNDENDFVDRGAVVFDFTSPSDLVSIDLIDINGGNNVVLTLTDDQGALRVFDVPPMWTNDVTLAPNGYDTLLFNTLTPQAGEGTGGDATVIQNDLGFDINNVVQLEVAMLGSPSSGGMDNLVFNSVVPEPTTGLLLMVGLFVAARSRRSS
jgi:hypothetical protein